MGYVQAGYSIVLGLLFLYGLQLLWRRRRLNRAVARVVASGAGDPGASTAGTPTVRSAGGHAIARPPGDR